jgi:uncharacterized protein YjbJ (UPF0337 family)
MAEKADKAKGTMKEKVDDAVDTVKDKVKGVFQRDDKSA